MMFVNIPSTELQIRGGIRDNSEISFLIYKENICCDPSLKPSPGDSFNDGSQNMFLWRNMANYACYPFLSGALYLLYILRYTCMITQNRSRSDWLVSVLFKILSIILLFGNLARK